MLEASLYMFVIWMSSGIEKVIHNQTAMGIPSLLGIRVWTRGVTRLLGAGEMVIAVVLLVTPKLGLLLSVLLLVIYTSAIVIVLSRTTLRVPCGCGGILGSVPISKYHVVRNAVLLMVALAAMIDPQSVLSAPLDRIAAASAGAVLLVAATYMMSEVYTATVAP